MSQERQKDRPEEYVVCPCFNVKRGQIMRCLESGSARDLDEIRILSHAGAGCAGCEFEVEELVEEFYRERGPTGLSTRQKALRKLLILNKRLIERNVELLRNVRSTFSPRPSFFGTWWVERADLHTRINLCNIASPAAPQRLWTEWITIEVFSETGALLSANDRTLRQSETFSCEVRDLLPDSCLGGHGLLRVKYHNRRALGSKRFYSHYHNAKGLTLVHEKFSGYRKLTVLREPLETFLPDAAAWLRDSNGIGTLMTETSYKMVQYLLVRDRHTGRCSAMDHLLPIYP